MVNYNPISEWYQLQKAQMYLRSKTDYEVALEELDKEFPGWVDDGK